MRAPDSLRDQDVQQLAPDQDEGVSSAASPVDDALAAGGVGIWSWNPATKLFKADATARRLWGLPEDGAVGAAKLLGAVHPADAPRVRSAVFGAREPGSDCDILVRVQRDAAAARRIRVRGRAIVDRSGSLHMVGVALDVGNAAEEEPATIEARLRAAGMLGGAIPFEWVARTGELLAPPALRQLYGVAPAGPFDREAALSRIHPDDRATVKEGQDRMLAAPGPYEAEFRVPTPDGATRWIRAQGAAVRDAAGAVTGIAGIHLDVTARRTAEDELRRARREARARFREIRALYHNAPVGLALLDDAFRQVRANRKLAELTSSGAAEDQVGRPLFELAPEAHARLMPVLREVLESGEPRSECGIAYALPSDPKSARVFNCHFYPLEGEQGVLGVGVVVEDMTAHNQLAQARDLLSRELSHRIKNLFAVVSSLITLSAKGDDSLKGFARTIRGRIEALGRAHDYVRPSEWDRDPARVRTLQNLLATLLAPYREGDGPSPDGPRLVIGGADPIVGPFSTTALALAVHEFATNAMKYGALSRPGGSVEIACRERDGMLELTWTERGGPAVEGKPERSGFGSMLATRSIASDLSGSVEIDWARDGLIIRVVAPLQRLAR